jgi:hypothetical protein
MEKKLRTSFNQLAAVAALGILLAIPCRAQQGQAQQAPEVSKRYTRVGLQALRAIQASESTVPDVDISPALEAIDAAQSAAATDAERRFSAILYHVYHSKVRDNEVIAAYQRVIEAESFTDDSENRQVRASKDYAASELTDTVTEIQNREDRCFRQLETSLNQGLHQGSLRDLSACSALIQ